MSPSSSTSREMTGPPRPAPLKIHKDSHNIHKSSSSSSSSSASTGTGTGTNNQNQRHHHPVIIYTHSPKVIHTQARDFMALVQKLTGLSHSNADDDQPARPPGADNDSISAKVAVDSSSSPSSSSDQNSGLSCDLPPPLGPGYHHSMQDIPLFTPNSSDYFCSPASSFYRYPDASMFSPPPNPNNAAAAAAASPLFIDAMKPFPDY